MSEQHEPAVSQQEIRGTPEASVVIIAFTMERWSLTCAAVESVCHQTVPPREIILCVEGAELAARFKERFAGERAGAPPIRVIDSDTEYGEAASAGEEALAPYACHEQSAVERTRGVQLASAEIVAFLDDDASAEPDWLERLLAPFADPSVVAVGGAPLPVYAKPRPRWFPGEFNWVFGCAYTGLPNETAPALRLIGANMAARRESVLAVGGVQSLADDLDLAHRLLALSPQNRLIYEPAAIVHHYVHEHRLTWHYFWRKCYAANHDKVAIMRGLGSAGNLDADLRFVRRNLPLGVGRGLREFVGGDIGGLERALSIIAGAAVAAVAYGIGLVRWNLSARRRHAGFAGRSAGP
jgi:GT2 family glycosyltransferase